MQDKQRQDQNETDKSNDCGSNANSGSSVAIRMRNCLENNELILWVFYFSETIFISRQTVSLQIIKIKRN